jgi:nicotinate phosphoribosyltransferase
MNTPGLLTDRYELTMVKAAIRSGEASRRCVFEVFARSLSGDRRYAVVAGLGRLLADLPHFRFDDESLRYLTDAGVIDAPTRDYLASYRFTGSINAYAEGEVFFPGSPVLTVEGTFAECVVLETLVLSILNHDSAVATAAARMVGAAESRPCIEMGSRRTHEVAAVASARAAYIAGFAATSNLAAGQRWGIPTTGTAAHAFTLLHDDERAAFAAQVAALGPETTLLVDTYDVTQGIRNAVDVAGTSLGAIRLDSGELKPQAIEARRLLDQLGAHATRIVVTSDLNEFSIAALADAPIDGYGVGTSVVTGSGEPTAGFVYKIVARELPGGGWQPVAKTSVGKASHGGRKLAARRLDNERTAVAELIRTGDGAAAGADERPLQIAVVREGELGERRDVETARRQCAASIAELPLTARKLAAGGPAIETISDPV